MNFLRIFAQNTKFGSHTTKALRSVAQQNVFKQTPKPSRFLGAYRCMQTTGISNVDITHKVQQKRATRKPANADNIELSGQGFYNVSAFATAEEYNLEALYEGLTSQGLYKTKQFLSTDTLGCEQDVLFASAQYPVGPESRDVFFFREGSVVMWNFNEIETNNMLSFLKTFEKESYLKPLVRVESEIMPYTYIPQTDKGADNQHQQHNEENQSKIGRAFFQNGKFFLTQGENNFYEKYTFSNAMSTSIKLGIWEATLERYIDSTQYLTDDLKRGRRIRINRRDLLRKTGELFALRHGINLSSDLLDTPDFYWDREELEALYLQVCAYFSISRRTKVMNEKISHCLALAELVSDNLNDAHHIRLEWMIIILIMVEVAFEIAHYMERYYDHEGDAYVGVTSNKIHQKPGDSTVKASLSNVNS